MAKSTPSSLPAPSPPPIAQPPTISDSSTTTLAIPVPVAIPLSKPSLSPTKPPPQHKLPSPRNLISRTKALIPFIKPSQTFSKFSLLPNELRLKIWQATIQNRVHELHPCANLYNNRMTFRSNASSTPAIFHACRQSRFVALEHYRLMEYTPSNTAYLGEEGGTGNGKGILRFYFAPEYDTLLLNSLMGLFVMFMLLEDNNVNAPPSILSTGGPTAGVMAGWHRVAIDAERAQLITLLSGINGHSPQPGFKKLLPDLKELVVAFDYTRSGKTRFRTSVWPGENGTTLTGHVLGGDLSEGGVMNECLEPLRGFLRRDYGRENATSNDAISANVASPASTAHSASNAAHSGSVHLDGDLTSNVGVNGEEDEIDERDIVPVDENAGIPIIAVARVRRKRYVRGDLRYAFRWSCSLVRVRPRGIFRRL